MKKKISVAVSGVGGGVGQSIIKALSSSDVTLIGMDGESFATGLYAVSKGYLIPYANDPKFLDEVLRICFKEKCRFFFPGLDIELPILSKNIDKFKQIGTNVIVSEPNVIDICDDKLLTHKFLLKNKIPTPITVSLTDFLSGKISFDFPVILKPKKGGARSRDVSLIRNKLDLDRILSNQPLDNYVVQEYIDGLEYTCGTVTMDNQYFGTIIMRRILRDGDTYKCFVEKNKTIEKIVAKTINALRPFGACNVQLRLKDNVPFIFEINARCSGTTAARAMAGFNEPRMILDYLLYKKKMNYKIREMSFLRYWNEFSVDQNKIQDVLEDGVVENTNVKKL